MITVRNAVSGDIPYIAAIEHESFPDPWTENGLAEFLFHIIDQDYDKARRRPVSIPAKAEEACKLRHELFETKIYRYYKKVCNQIKRFRTGTLLTSKRTK